MPIGLLVLEHRKPDSLYFLSTCIMQAKQGAIAEERSDVIREAAKIHVTYYNSKAFLFIPET